MTKTIYTTSIYLCFYSDLFLIINFYFVFFSEGAQAKVTPPRLRSFSSAVKISRSNSLGLYLAPVFYPNVDDFTVGNY